MDLIFHVVNQNFLMAISLSLILIIINSSYLFLYLNIKVKFKHFMRCEFFIDINKFEIFNIK